METVDLNMTIEDIIAELKDASDHEVKYGDIKNHYNEVMKRVTAFDMAIKSLKAWEKVRAEIENLYEYPSRDDYIHQKSENKEAENDPNMMQQTMDFLKNLYLQNKEEIDRVTKEYEQYKADDILPQCMQIPLKTYEVWMEGYNCTGQSKQHEFIGAVKAESFEKACEIAIKQWCKSVADFDRYYDAKTQTFWGCRCYDNESDAAKGFG